MFGQPGSVQEVEKFIHVEDKEKMKAMEDQLEAEKKQIMKDFERQKASINAKVEIAEEDRQRLLAELESKNEAQQKEKAEQQKLVKRIKNMEDKLLHGTEAMQKAMRQEQKLLKSKAELEERRRQQLMLQ